jgi:hypothetical protein
MMLEKLGRITGLRRKPDTQNSGTIPEDPFESIKNSVSSVSDHFRKLGAEFEPTEPVQVDPKALPAKRRPKRSPSKNIKPSGQTADSDSAVSEVQVRKVASRATKNASATKKPASKTTKAATPTDTPTAAKNKPSAQARKTTNSNTRTTRKPNSK